MQSSDTAYGRWVRRFNLSPDDPLLICFPHAGGSANYYRSLSCYSRNWEVWAIQYPGGLERINERPAGSVIELAECGIEEIFSVVKDRQLYFFGHSLGAFVAFEFANQLERLGKGVNHLFVSGSNAPTGTMRGELLPRDDAALIDSLIRWEGTEEELIRNPDFIDLILPILRSDISLADSYSVATGTRLNAQITALSGSEDYAATRAGIERWFSLSKHVKKSSYEFPGGHFYLNDNFDRVARIILQSEIKDLF